MLNPDSVTPNYVQLTTMPYIFGKGVYSLYREEVKLFFSIIYPNGFMVPFFKKIFIYLFMAVLGLRFCVRAFSSCGKRGPLFIVVRGPLTLAASVIAEHRLQTRWLSSCGSRA